MASSFLARCFYTNEYIRQRPRDTLEQVTSSGVFEVFHALLLVHIFPFSRFQVRFREERAYFTDSFNTTFLSAIFGLCSTSYFRIIFVSNLSRGYRQKLVVRGAGKLCEI